MSTDSSAYLVRAITRAADILDRIQHNGAPASLKELTEQSGLTKPTVLRMLRNLEHIGLVERVPGTDDYRLGLRCVELGQAYLDQVDFRREALPVLERLRDRYHETVHLAVLDESLRVVYLEKLEGKHAIGIMMSRVGRSAPAYCTGLGKALLSEHPGDPVTDLESRGELVRKTENTIHDPDDLRTELAAIRERGFALDLEEHEPGVCCVAATIRDSNQVLGALSIAGPTNRLSEEQLAGELADATVDAAFEISQRVGGGTGRGET